MKSTGNRRRMFVALVPIWALCIPFAATAAQSLPSHPHHSYAHTDSTKTASVRLFLIALGNGTVKKGQVGCGDAVVAVQRPIVPTTAPLAAAIRLLIADHRRSYGASGLYNALYRARLHLQRVRLVNGKASIYLLGKLNLGGECDDPRVRAQLHRTALQFKSVRSATFYLNGVLLSRVLGGKG